MSTEGYNIVIDNHFNLQKFDAFCFTSFPRDRGLWSRAFAAAKITLKMYKNYPENYPEFALKITQKLPKIYPETLQIISSLTDCSLSSRGDLWSQVLAAAKITWNQ